MKLKEMREKQGLTQAELSYLSGVNFRSLQDYEQGHKSLKSAKGETLLRLSHILGFSVEDIIKDDETDIELFINNSKVISNRIKAYEKNINDRRTKVCHFPVIVDDEILDMSRIYPTKQNQVKEVIDNLRTNKYVKDLYLFGSSISMACNKDSDIDFAVGLTSDELNVKNSVSEKIQRICGWNADIIWINHLDPNERLYKEIQKGLVLI